MSSISVVFGKHSAPLHNPNAVQVSLNSPVPVSERVEEWLEHLNAEMKGTLTSLLQECLRGQIDYDRFPSQVTTVEPWRRVVSSSIISVDARE